ncbi:TetR/AcrR family transcriptional regulator [Niallia sp. Krafla_26]|uniref:TetR/AcrR family transcriptional regulator n=1 Tax=Niallia sp. Krafla_26 TaxID=3064703 RepID=UPI003D16CFFE
MARERKFSKQELFQHTKELLLHHHYEGFTFSLLANRLQVSRGTLYKYYENKEELITDFMLDEMSQFLISLKDIDQFDSFNAQFDFLLNLILQKTDIHQLIGMSHQIPIQVNEKVRANKKKLDEMHLDMYHRLQNFIFLGRKEEKLKPHLADGLILGFIFQTVSIPNHFGVPQTEWIQSIKEILSDGMFTKN